MGPTSDSSSLQIEPESRDEYDTAPGMMRTRLRAELRSDRLAANGECGVVASTDFAALSTRFCYETGDAERMVQAATTNGILRRNSTRAVSSVSMDVRNYFSPRVSESS
jgi:hypothetical protein